MKPVLLSALSLALLAACADREADPGEPTEEAVEAAATGPRAVLEAYYEAISQRDFDTAWQLWGQDPQGDPEAFATFMRGFAETELTSADIGEPSEPRVNNGFVAVRIPVRVEDLMSDGTGRSYDGTYTLRRPAGEEGEWHIISGDLDLAPTRPPGG